MLVCFQAVNLYYKYIYFHFITEIWRDNGFINFSITLFFYTIEEENNLRRNEEMVLD